MIVKIVRPEIVIETIEIKEVLVDALNAAIPFLPTTEVLIPTIPAWVKI